MKGKNISSKLMKKQSALMGIIQAMKGLDLEHIKGYKDKKKTKKPDMEATMEKLGEVEDEEELEELED